MKPFKPIQIRWAEKIGKSDCPYLIRWVFNFYFFSIRLHHFIRSDDKRYFHDHPWWFIVFVLKGFYVDASEQGIDRLTAGEIRYRSPIHRHFVIVPKGGVWTLLLTGMHQRNWGFWVNGKLKRPLKYFHKFGHPPCIEQ